MLYPNIQEFTNAYTQRKRQVVYTRYTADLETPVSVMLKLAERGELPFSFMLESVSGGDNRGRYSVVGFDPDMIWQCTKGQSSIHKLADDNNASTPVAPAFVPQSGCPLHHLRQLIKDSRIDDLPAAIPPIACGVFGFLGYEMIGLIETLPPAKTDPIDIPDAVLLRPRSVVVVDHVNSDLIIVCPVFPQSSTSAPAPPAAAVYKQTCARIQSVINKLSHALRVKPPPRATAHFEHTQNNTVKQSNFTRAAYVSAVKKAQSYIKQGDIFQVVLAQRWTHDFTDPPFALYRSLRRTNPSPFMFFFNFGDFQVIGASPEILVRLRGSEITVRPIAGTRPRGKNRIEDRQLAQDLLADPKERAEHLMLLDLGRNDVGRVARFGTVKPTEQFTIETYSHVMHITSNVVGELCSDADALDALLAGLPAGTVSGAPKIRAMEIINALEPEKRGVYAGGCGYFAANGDMDMCIALRTAVTKNGKLYIQAGGGIVYDSDPDAEFEESVNKSKALVVAAEQAADFNTDSGMVPAATNKH